MKNHIQKTILITSISLFLFSCGSKDDKAKSKAELTKLKQEQKDLQAKIAELEKQNNSGNWGYKPNDFFESLNRKQNQVYYY